MAGGDDTLEENSDPFILRITHARNRNVGTTDIELEEYRSPLRPADDDTSRVQSISSREMEEPFDLRKECYSCWIIVP